MTQTDRLQALANELRASLRAAYEDGEGALGSQPLQDAFSQFGTRAAETGISLENIMAGSVDVLQEFFEREGGYGTDPSTMLAAGVSLAAAARGSAELSAVQTDSRTATPLPSQVARLTALHRINRAATANLKLKEMLETTVGVVAETTGSDACAVFLYDDATGLLALRAAVGLNPTAVGAITIRLGYGITGTAAETRELISAPDARKHPAFSAHPGIGDEIYQSQVSVPMLLQGQDRLVGVLNILTIGRREFGEDDLEFLRTVAGEMAISIENARQYSSTDERLRVKLDELNKLQRISRIVTSTLNLSEVLRLITEQAVELIQAEAAAIYRRQHLPGGVDGEFQPVIEYRIGSRREVADPGQRDRLVSEVLRSGQPRNEEVAYADGMCTLFCLPLRSARETLGTLCFRLRAGYEMTEDSLGLLRTFSDSAALAIENAELYQDAMQSLNVQSTLVQEMHHRVRNNLQTVAALLSLQLRSAPDAPWETEIREAVSRIQAIATVHDLLSDESRLRGTTVDVIARHVAEDAYSTLIPPSLHVHFDIGESDLTVPSRQATILSLLINELISNAISHGFADRPLGYIRFRADHEGSLATIEIFNDGHRIPAGFDPAQSEGLGMRIVQRLVTSDLRGTFTIASDETGTTARIVFPVATSDEA